jgi:hypothetical protein
MEVLLVVVVVVAAVVALFIEFSLE